MVVTSNLYVTFAQNAGLHIHVLASFKSTYRMHGNTSINAYIVYVYAA